MTHDSPDPHAEGTMGSQPSQGMFIGNLALGLMIFVGLFTLFVLISAAVGG